MQGDTKGKVSVMAITASKAEKEAREANERIKPPIGAVDYKEWLEQRVKELNDALTRNIDMGGFTHRISLKTMRDWARELDKHLTELWRLSVADDDDDEDEEEDEC